MEEARKKLRRCLFFVVMAAVVIGFIYYFSSLRVETQISDGTLVSLVGEFEYA